MSKGIPESLMDSGAVDSILSIRDSIGAVKQPVYLVKRVWSGEAQGDGVACDTEVKLCPSPRIVDLSHSIRAQEGGFIRQGDLILRGVSRNLYDEDELRGKSTDKSIEHFYRVGEFLYQAISVTEKYVTFNVQVRRLSDQRRYVNGDEGGQTE